MTQVLLNVLQYNMAKLQDPHVHTYCTAALTNMSPHCQRLHTHASERLVKLFRNLSKKYFHLCEKLREDEDEGKEKESTSNDKEEITQHAEACQELLRMLLDIILLCVSQGVIRHNTTLIYVLLHEKKMFDMFKSHTVFGSLVAPLVELLSYVVFRVHSHLCAENAIMSKYRYIYKQLEKLQAPETWTYESVLKHIDELCNVWQGPELPRPVATNEEMKSRYEEAAGSEGFFEPFMWKAIVSHAADIDWQPKNAVMFNNGGGGREDEEEKVDEKMEEDVLRSPMEL